MHTMQRRWKKLETYKQIVIGIDRPYQNTNISAIADGKLKDIKSVRLDKHKSNSERRGVGAQDHVCWNVGLVE